MPRGGGIAKNVMQGVKDTKWYNIWSSYLSWYCPLKAKAITYARDPASTQHHDQSNLVGYHGASHATQYPSDQWETLFAIKVRDRLREWVVLHLQQI
jgi:hypothetical protein